MENEITQHLGTFFALSWMVLFVLFGIIGFNLGAKKDRPNAGFLLGAFFGPIGWIVSLLLPYTGGRCPECRGHHPVGANKCIHCGKKFSN